MKCTINTGRGADIFTLDHSQSAAAEVVLTDVLASVSVYHFKEAIFCHLELIEQISRGQERHGTSG